MFDDDDTLAYEPATTAAVILTGGDDEAETAALEVWLLLGRQAKVRLDGKWIGIDALSFTSGKDMPVGARNTQACNVALQGLALSPQKVGKNIITGICYVLG